MSNIQPEPIKPLSPGNYMKVHLQSILHDSGNKEDILMAWAFMILRNRFEANFFSNDFGKYFNEKNQILSLELYQSIWDHPSTLKEIAFSVLQTYIFRSDRPEFSRLLLKWDGRSDMLINNYLTDLIQIDTFDYTSFCLLLAILYRLRNRSFHWPKWMDLEYTENIADLVPAVYFLYMTHSKLGKKIIS